MSSEIVFFSSSSRSIRSTKAFSWSLANRVLAASGCSFSTADILDAPKSISGGDCPRRFTLSFRESGPPGQGAAATAPVIHKAHCGEQIFLSHDSLPGREGDERTRNPEPLVQAAPGFRA